MSQYYRKLQQWNNWCSETMGSELLSLEKNYLKKYTAIIKGKQVLLIGLPGQLKLFEAFASIQHPILVTPLTHVLEKIKIIESELDELPILSGSVDFVIVSHALDYVARPHHLLSEACRVIKPQGHIILFGFNPKSLWGVKKYWIKNKTKLCPWNAHFLSALKIKHWLKSAEFTLIKEDNLLFRPPFFEKFLFSKLKWMESFGKKMYKPLGGVYFLLAQANVIPLTPIRMRWKKSLKNFNPSVAVGSMSRVI